MLLSGQGLADAQRIFSEPFTPDARWYWAYEWIGLVFHGSAITHIDGLSHVFWDRKQYNGVPAEHVTSWEGASKAAITSLKDGLLTRGVLIDAPRLRGVEWLQGGQPIYPADLDAAEAASGLTIGKGDAVLLRTGYLRHRGEREPSEEPKPGFHVTCMPWFHERGVSLIGTDADCDVLPSGYPSCPAPCHTIALVSMGLPILDCCDLEELAEVAAQFQRYDFMLTLAPLPIQGGTGSPVNPIATF
jgi:kynurenine formamidase